MTSTQAVTDKAGQAAASNKASFASSYHFLPPSVKRYKFSIGGPAGTPHGFQSLDRVNSSEEATKRIIAINRNNTMKRINTILKRSCRKEKSPLSKPTNKEVAVSCEEVSSA